MAKSISVWDGSQFVPANVPVGAVPNAVVSYSSTAPSNPKTGQAWFDTNNSRLKVYSGSTWIEVSVNLSAYAQLSGATFTGNVVVPSGSASAPSIAPTGDTNTGIFFPAADTIAFSEGGVEAMRIDSSGRITMPSKPMFMGFPTADYSTGGMPTGIIAFTASYNNGGYYSAANNRFTCPIAGWYRVTWGGLQLPSTVTSLVVNGTRTYNGNHYAGTNVPAYITMTQTVVRSFAANDYLQIDGWNGGGYFSGWYLWTVEQIA